MNQQLNLEQLRLLPKVELHQHLDCSMRWSTLLEIARTLKLEIPNSPEQQKQHFLVTSPMVNLESVLNKFLIAQKLLASEEILERLAFEVCEDAFNNGVRILELRYAPTFITDGNSNLNFEKIHSAFLRGLARAEKAMPIATGLICILQRILSAERADKVMNFAIEQKDSFIAVDLADNEEGFEPTRFAKHFERAHQAGLHVTVHSGESPSPLAAKWIQDSIITLGAERIGHGVQSIHSPETIQLLKQKNILLEVCPYSNYLTQAFTTYDNHPLQALHKAGVPVAICSDDPGMFDSSLTHDYWLAQIHQKFTPDDFMKCNEMAYQHSFISESKKARVWKH